MNYDELDLKIPQETPYYEELSDFAITAIEQIIEDAITSWRNKIIINTNLKLWLPMENINKIAWPFVEAWAQETFENIKQDENNKRSLINVEALGRLNRADVLLQFKREDIENPVITAEVDVKATTEDFTSSWKSPNITSFARIRSAYIEDPDYIFIILSLRHKVYSVKNTLTDLMDGIMEVVNYHAYDLKYLSGSDISYNPALGTWQIQIKDINYVTVEKRTTREFCRLLDKKYLSSQKQTIDSRLNLAKQFKRIKWT